MMNLKTSRIIAALTLALMAPACAPLATVKVGKCNYQPVHGATEVAQAHRCERGDSIRALGCYLDAARDAESALKANPKDDTARKDYNYAVARAVEILLNQNADPSKTPLKVPSDHGDFVVTEKIPKGIKHRLRDFEDHAADSIKVGGKYFTERAVTEGVGAPFVGITKEKDKDFRKDFSSEYAFGSVTAVARFSGPDRQKVEVEFLLPLTTDTVTIDGHTYPLQKDFNASMALVMEKARPEKLGLSRLLNPEKYSNTARLTRLQPYDPNRIPVLLVHGLQDTPASWAPMVNTLMSDEEIRKNYQFWVYSYPSGYPYPYSASLMRDELDEVQRVFPNHKKIVLVGHSMGGCVSRLMITDSGDKLWRSFFGEDPAHTKLAGPSRDLMKKVVIFEHRKDVSRVIFMSAPHRGSKIASNWIGRVASKLVHAPSTLAKTTRSAFAMVTMDRSALKLSRMPNSIDTLAPNNRFVVAINKIPITPGIPYHSIIGDRNKGDTPNSSDGVVEYWSSHLDGAQSELIVPSNHGTPRNPQGIQEVRRILKLHLQH